MGDIKLSPRQTASLLNKLDESTKQMADARKQIIEAMAERAPSPHVSQPSKLVSRKKR